VRAERREKLSQKSKPLVNEESTLVFGYRPMPKMSRRMGIFIAHWSCCIAPAPQRRATNITSVPELLPPSDRVRRRRNSDRLRASRSRIRRFAAKAPQRGQGDDTSCRMTNSRTRCDSSLRTLLLSRRAGEGDDALRIDQAHIKKRVPAALPPRRDNLLRRKLVLVRLRIC
jgi:hypothetical protein